MTAAPLNYRWDGEAMRPLAPDAARRIFTPGRAYRLAEYDDRSRRSHRHFFAAVRTAWENLPPDLATRFPTPEHLRKYALIREGWADSRTIVAADKQNATVIVALVEAFDEYAICEIQSNVVVVWTAQSQNMRAMGKRTFEDSKRAVVAHLAHMIGVSQEMLTDNSRTDT